MLRTDVKMGAFLLSYTVTPKKIGRIFDKNGPFFDRPQRPVPPEKRKVAALELTPRAFTGLEDYIQYLELAMAGAVATGAQLVLFPQWTGMLPLSLLPAFQKIKTDLERLEESDENYREAFWLLMENLAGFLRETHLNIFEQLAREHQVAILAGSLYWLEEGRITNRALLFGPDGQVQGTQDKLIISPLETRLGVTPGKTVGCWQTRAGRVGVLFEEDLTAYEPAKVAAELGAQVLLCPGGSIGKRPPLWSLTPAFRTQEENCYLVRSSLTGELGFTFGGEAAAYAPYRLTARRDGMLAGYSPGAGVAVGVVDPTHLTEGLELPDRNPLFCQQVLLPLCLGEKPREQQPPSPLTPEPEEGSTPPAPPAEEPQLTLPDWAPDDSTELPAQPDASDLQNPAPVPPLDPLPHGEPGQLTLEEVVEEAAQPTLEELLEMTQPHGHPTEENPL